MYGNGSLERWRAIETTVHLSPLSWLGIYKDWMTSFFTDFFECHTESAFRFRDYVCFFAGTRTSSA